MICPNCKKSLPDNMKFCKYCGCKMTQEEPQFRKPMGTMEPLPPKPQKRSKLPVILLSILCLVLIAAAIFFGWSYANKKFIFSEDKKKEQVTERESESTTDDIDIITIGGKKETSEEEKTTEDTTIRVAGNISSDAEYGEMCEAEILARKYTDHVVTYNDHAYAIFNIEEEGLSSYTECERFCENMGGYLACIESEDENDFLYKFVQDSGLVLAFFGYSDAGAEGHWRWSNGSSNSYTNWAKGQPNNGAKNDHPSPENYAEFYKDKANGTWNDAIFGKNTYRFICEWE